MGDLRWYIYYNGGLTGKAMYYIGNSKWSECISETKMFKSSKEVTAAYNNVIHSMKQNVYITSIYEYQLARMLLNG